MNKDTKKLADVYTEQIQLQPSSKKHHYNGGMKEQLKSIHKECVQLLEGAEKRTPGLWDNQMKDGHGQELVGPINTLGLVTHPVVKMDSEADAYFIANCAGFAEAGWRTTIIAIDRLLKGSIESESDVNEAKEIIAVWENIG